MTQSNQTTAISSIFYCISFIYQCSVLVFFKNHILIFHLLQSFITCIETEVKLSFKYRVLGSASLTLVYKEAGQPEVTQVINGNDSDSWSDWSGYVPAGKDTYVRLQTFNMRQSLYSRTDALTQVVGRYPRWFDFRKRKTCTPK